MPRAENLTWDDGNLRWRKKYRGKAYTISTRQLGTAPNKSASLTLANEWWKQKRAEIDIGIRGQLEADRTSLQAIISANLEKSLRQAEGEMMFEALGNDRQWSMITPLVEEAKTTVNRIDYPVDTDKTILSAFNRFKSAELGRAEAKQISIGRAKANIRGVEIFLNSIVPQTPLENIDEQTVSTYYDYLLKADYDDNYKAKLWQLFKTFIRQLSEDKKITLPSNLSSRRWKFKIMYSSPKLWSCSDIAHIHEGESRLVRLWILLMLNCGYRQVDIGELRDDEVDWFAGTITKRRGKIVKTGKKCPEVMWYLWPETFALLKQYRSGKELVFVDADGSPLYLDQYKDGRRTQKDVIGRTLNKIRIAKGIVPEIASLRATSASMLDHHAEYGRYSSYFLGEKPSGTQARHYIVPSGEQFKLAMDWLRAQYSV